MGIISQEDWYLIILQTVTAILLVVRLLLCPSKKIREYKPRHITSPGWRGFWGGAGVADTTRGSGMGYGIMKYTSHSQRASPHLSWGSQIAQVTKPPYFTHTIHTPAMPKPHHRYAPPRPWSYVQFVLYLFANVGVTAARIWAAISLPSPFILMLQSGRIKYPSWFPRRKKGKNIQEMKVVTRSSVCQTSPWAGTKGPEKSCCCAYFSLQMREEQGGQRRGQGEKRRHEIKMSEGLGIIRMQWGMDWNDFLRQWKRRRLLQWWNWSAPAALCAKSPTSHRYSCTKQNKLPIPALQYVFQRASPERKPSWLEGIQDKGRKRERSAWTNTFGRLYTHSDAY